MSPFARGNPAKPRINSLLFDHTSVLKLIEWRWNLEPLTARDASEEIANLASALIRAWFSPIENRSVPREAASTSIAV